MKILGSTVGAVLVSLAFLFPSITAIHNLGIEAPFSLKGAVLLQFMNVLFAQTSEIYYSESLRAFFHSMSLTSSLMFPISTLLLIYSESCWFVVHSHSHIFGREVQNSRHSFRWSKEKGCLWKSAFGAHLEVLFIFRNEYRPHPTLLLELIWWGL